MHDAKGNKVIGGPIGIIILAHRALKAKRFESSIDDENRYKLLRHARLQESRKDLALLLKFDYEVKKVLDHSVSSFQFKISDSYIPYFDLEKLREDNPLVDIEELGNSEYKVTLREDEID